jgi:hypothetical protein
MMDMPDDCTVDEQIRISVSESVPPLVEHRLRSQMAGLRSRLSQPCPAVTRPTRVWTRAVAWWGLGATGAAVVVLAAVAGLVLRPQVSFAEVTTAVLAQPWVHLRTVAADQTASEKSEEWFSPAKDVWASRWDGNIKYEDYRLQVFYSYIPAEQVLYRGPAVWKSRASQFEPMVDALKVLLQGDQPPDQPFAHLGWFLGPEREKMKVLDQRVEKVTEEGHTWLDYRLTVKNAGIADPLRMLLRVDPSTKLPRMSRTEGRSNGKPVTRETQFDYPEKGPADIYDLGVPKMAKLVDRVPAGDLKRILETLKAGGERMDPYRAVFVEQFGPDHPWWTARPEVFYRKGNRFRRDFGIGPTQDDAVKRPAADVDMRQWWLERAKHFRFYPIYVVVGPAYYLSGLKNVVDPDGSEHPEIAVDTHPWSSTIPIDYSMRPEFACRPPMGIGDEHQEPTLDMHPAEGPPGCIRLSVTHTTKVGRINEKGIGLADGNHFWLDPQRDYIVMRWDMVVREANGQVTVIESDTVEETARSPQGVWYATKVRRTFAGRPGKNKPGDQIYHIYVDFDADLPDSLFEPPKPGRVK